MSGLWRVMGLWRGEAVWLIGGVAMALVSAGALAGLAVMAGAAPLAGGVLVVVALRGLGVGRVVLRYLERLVTHGATFRALTALRMWMFRGLAGRSSGGLGFLRRGDALGRLVADVDALDGLYLRILVPLGATLLLLVAVAVLIGGRAPGVAVAVCALLAAAALVVPFVAARSTLEEGGRLARAGAGLRVAAVDALGGMREIRAFGNEGRMLAGLQAQEAGLFAAQRAVGRVAAVAQGVAALLGQAAVLVVVVSGLPAGVMLPALLLVVTAFEVAGAMPRAGSLAGHAAAAAGRVLEGSETGPRDAEGDGLAPSGTGLRFEGVRFAWPGRAAVLDGLTLDVPAGSRVAVLGPSGAGKSTLAALALKVVAPERGRVLLGGVDIAGLRAEAVRGQIAWLSQATHVFSDTVRANLLLGRADADEAALWAALGQAGLAEVVRGLPEGLDSWIGEGVAGLSTGLSGGQLRRVALARALVSTAPILILDEPATGLDDAAERAFFATLNEVAVGRTVVLIVHRLLGVERVDRIFRLSGGRAVAAAG